MQPSLTWSRVRGPFPSDRRALGMSLRPRLGVGASQNAFRSHSPPLGSGSVRARAHPASGSRRYAPQKLAGWIVNPQIAKVIDGEAAVNTGPTTAERMKPAEFPRPSSGAGGSPRGAGSSRSEVRSWFGGAGNAATLNAETCFSAGRVFFLRVSFAVLTPRLIIIYPS